MPVLPATSANIEYAAKLLREGLPVAFPTETVYGLGADVFNVAALARVFEIKRRPRFDPLIVHIARMETLDLLLDFSALSPLAKERLALLAARFWPGPLTVVLPKSSRVPGLATAGLGTVAVRFPDNPVALELIRRLGAEGGAVAAPSANPFGYLSPTRAEHVAAQLGDRVPLILDGGPCRIGVESTVLDIGGGAAAGERPRILRPGGVTREALSAIIPDIAVSAQELPAEEREGEAGRLSPGQAKSHYAPSTPLRLHSRAEMRSLPALPGHACLCMEETPQKYAAQLFEKLHALDARGYIAIHAELAPEEGIGIAINDRLRRAAAKTR